jgi:hypothetical protein
MSFRLQPSRRLCIALAVGLALSAGVLGLARNATADLSPDVYDYAVADRLPVVLTGSRANPTIGTTSTASIRIPPTTSGPTKWR